MGTLTPTIRRWTLLSCARPQQVRNSSTGSNPQTSLSSMILPLLLTYLVTLSRSSALSDVSPGLQRMISALITLLSSSSFLSGLTEPLLLHRGSILAGQLAALCGYGREIAPLRPPPSSLTSLYTLVPQLIVSAAKKAIPFGSLKRHPNACGLRTSRPQ